MLKARVKNQSDEEIVKIVVARQRSDEFGILYDRYSEKVFRKCISFVKDVDQAKDLTHDIFLKTFLNLSKFNFKSKFSTWLYSLTYNYCIDFLRKENRLKTETSDQIADVPDDQDDLNEKELLSIKAQRLIEVLENIPVKEKAILLMKYQDEMSIEDIKGVLNVSESAVKMRLKRAKAKALETYRKMFGDE